MSSPDRHRHVSAIRRLLRLRPQPDQNPLLSNGAAKKPNMLLRGLGCTSSAAAHVPSGNSGIQVAPSAVRETSDWDGKRNKRRRKKKKDKKGAASAGGGGAAASADVWCVESSVDCVVERAHRERPYISRRVSMQEQIAAYMESPSPNLDAHFFGSEMLPPGRLLHRARRYHHSPPVLEDEVMMYSTRMLFGGMNFYDRHRDWRLDVDHMSYEELLDLGEKIGHVSTGLREDEILCKIRPFIFDPSIHFASSETERKCSVCQEEYEEKEEMGKLECGHGYHLYCIKQWLAHKNSCPLCKTSVSKNEN